MQAVAAAATLQDVPHSADGTLAPRTCVVELIYLSNSNTGEGAERTVVLQDGYGKQLFPAIPLPGPSVTRLEPRRIRCVGGLTWRASGAGVVGSVLLQA